jgi:hypothetical protein
MNRAPVDDKAMFRQERESEAAAAIERGRVRMAAEALAEVAERLAAGEGRMKGELSLAAASLREAMASHPDKPEWWIGVGPFVIERSGYPRSLVEMLIDVPGSDDPRRLAAVLLRALEWRLPH